MRQRRSLSIFFRTGATLCILYRPVAILAMVPSSQYLTPYFIPQFLLAVSALTLFAVSLWREFWPGRTGPGPKGFFWRNGLTDHLLLLLLAGTLIIAVWSLVGQIFSRGIDYTEAPITLILAIVMVQMLRGFLRWGDFENGTPRDLSQMIKGDWFLCPMPVVIHNATDQYISTMGAREEQPARKELAVDWERDVEHHPRLTEAGRGLFHRRASLLLYILPAEDRDGAQRALDELCEKLLAGGELGVSTLLAVVFVMDAPFDAAEAPTPSAARYIAQCTVQAVRHARDISMLRLLTPRFSYESPGVLEYLEMYEMVQESAEFHQRIRTGEETISREKLEPMQKITAHLYQEPWDLWEGNCGIDIEPDPGDAPVPPGADPDQWDPLLREFFRGGLVQSPCLTGLMSLVDFMDLALRLALYTTLGQRGETTLKVELVPDTFRDLGAALAQYVGPGDLIYENVKAKTFAIEGFGEMIAWLMADILHCQFTGEGRFSLQGLCGFLSYFRNKTRGHGSIRNEDAELYWAFAVTMAQLLGQMLRLDVFTVRQGENGQILAGWNGQMVELGELALSGQYPPGLVFHVEEKKSGNLKTRYINYFNGTLLAPSIQKGGNPSTDQSQAQ